MECWAGESSKEESKPIQGKRDSQLMDAKLEDELMKKQGKQSRVQVQDIPQNDEMAGVLDHPC